MSASGGRSRSNYEGKSTVSRNSHRNFSTTESMVSKKPHRNFSTTESMRSSRYPPRSMPRTMQRTLQAVPYNQDGLDREVQDVISRYTQTRRPAPSRSQTHDAIDYRATVKSQISSRSNAYDLKRASTLPVDGPYLLPAPRTAPASRHTSRRGSVEDDKLKRHDSAISVQSRHSEARRSPTSQPDKPSLSRHDRDSHYSNASKASTAKTRDRDANNESASKASTAKPRHRSSTYDSAAAVPIPPSGTHSYYSAAEKPLPPSRSASHTSAAQVPAPSSRAGSRYPAVPEDAKVGMISDLDTVVPEDSISCVDFSSREREKRPSSSRHGSSSKRSEASTVKPTKERERKGSSRHSAQTLPMRSRDDVYGSEHKRSGKRSLMSFA